MSKQNDSGGPGGELAALRDAVAALPTNLPLRRQLAEALERAQLVDEALKVAQQASRNRRRQRWLPLSNSPQLQR